MPFRANLPALQERQSTVSALRAMSSHIVWAYQISTTRPLPRTVGAWTLGMSCVQVHITERLESVKFHAVTLLMRGGLQVGFSPQNWKSA